MTYGAVVKGTFRARPNRFIAQVNTEEGTQICHVKNTGRCKELLVPGATVYLAEGKNPARKTKYEAAGERWFVEVKGVTLEENGVALFPDAPTQRGVKHLRELIRCQQEGYRACALFVVQMQGISYFTPNRRTHPEFAQALEEAAAQGVRLEAVDCLVTPATLTPGAPVEIRLEG